MIKNTGKVGGLGEGGDGVGVGFGAWECNPIIKKFSLYFSKIQKYILKTKNYLFKIIKNKKN